jgi:hypothetical protein
MLNKTKIIMCVSAVSMLLFAVFYGQDVKNKKFFESVDGEIEFYKSKKSLKQIKEDFSKIKFEVELGKTDYLLLEPIILKCKFSNPTTETLDIYKPDIVSQLRLQTILNGKTDIRRDLFAIDVNKMPVIQPMKPGEVIEEQVLFQPNEGLLKKVGNYQLQFFINNSGENLLSNTINVFVKYPNGIDKEAYEFLLNNKNKDGLSVFSLNEVKGNNLLIETFVNKYIGTKYGSYAVLYLGKTYFYCGKINEAQIEYEKLINNENDFLAQEAKNALVKIENRKIELQNLDDEP